MPFYNRNDIFLYKNHTNLLMLDYLHKVNLVFYLQNMKSSGEICSLF